MDQATRNLFKEIDSLKTQFANTGGTVKPHRHEINDVNGLQTFVNQHNHIINDITELKIILDGFEKRISDLEGKPAKPI